MSEIEQVRAVIQEYINACRAGSVDRLQAIFHDHALMSGYMMGNYLMGSPQPFYDHIQNQPQQAGAGADYQAEITFIDISGPVASATLKEKGFMGMNFTDYFHLAKINDRWQIITKTFNPETD